jgi:hypothetical protein
MQARKGEGPGESGKREIFPQGPPKVFWRTSRPGKGRGLVSSGELCGPVSVNAPLRLDW